MCGIAGYFLDKNISDGRYISPLINAIRQRGPDDEGVLLISRLRKKFQAYRSDRTASPLSEQLPSVHNSIVIEHNLAFIHTRYSIIDLSSGGHQPFISQDGSIIAIFNGEIYNYVELKDELRGLGVKFRTSSDTEVLVEGYRVWKDQLWPKMNGFWAVVIYNVNEDKIVFSRDRIGVAPLYYRITDDGFYFASTIQALIDVIPQKVSIDQDVLAGFISEGIKDHDQSCFYKEIKSVPSASVVIFSTQTNRIEQALHFRYWNFPQARLSEKDISFEEAVDQFKDILFSSVELRLRSDVKVAFELSGGMDSSSVVAAAASVCKSSITTYTVKVKGADEEPYARAILEKYRLDYQVIVDQEDSLLHELDYFSKVMEEPYDNPNAYTHHKMLHVMKERGVHVVVTGAGGDEVFAGYEASFWPKAYQEWKVQGPQSWLKADWYETCRRYKTWNSTKKILKHYLCDSFKVFKRHVAQRQEKNVVRTKAENYAKSYRKLSFHEQSLYHFNVALVPFYMRSSDHFTMGIPIEHRFPLLDYRMVEFGLQLPISYLFRNGWTKYIVRKAMEPYLPKKIIWRRKKMGFSFPFNQYLSSHRNQLATYLDYLKPFSLSDKFLNYDQLLRTNAPQLWRVLSVAIWAKQQK